MAKMRRDLEVYVGERWMGGGKSERVKSAHKWMCEGCRCPGYVYVHPEWGCVLLRVGIGTYVG